MRFFVLASLLITLTAKAAEHKFAAGALLNINYPSIDNFDDEIAEETTSVNLGVAFKYRLVFDEKWSFRTGVTVEEKSAAIDYVLGEMSYNIIYFSVPVTLQYQIDEKVGIFGGVIPHSKINEYCSVDGLLDDCVILRKANPTVLYATIGLGLITNDEFDFDFSYQTPLSENVEKLKISTLQVLLSYKFN